MGTAWGPTCETCPQMGTGAYQEMCGMGTPGMIVNPLTGTTQEIDECQLMPGLKKLFEISVFLNMTFYIVSKQVERI